ncbi:hypothetical protein JQ633_12415 [Bradyrhizobium tropiciagri]|uniref:hypothetical protein n=1 Tax=Bradyrhizobium tropiciagri TaxID=312253 RepID=UPI001BA4D646|nr:hypothetical protein [Bradyrhizobium tropiciagri]MBR0871167.1 hypothetical protein [Bradyrhizobium tropiciagri]
MIILLKVVLAILMAFTAIALVCAVTLARRRPDPHASPYRDMPGFSREQLEAIARRPVEAHHGVGSTRRRLIGRSAAKQAKRTFGMRVAQ